MQILVFIHNVFYGPGIQYKSNRCLKTAPERDLIISPNEVFGDIMVLASPQCPRPPRRR